MMKGRPLSCGQRSHTGRPVIAHKCFTEMTRHLGDSFTDGLIKSISIFPSTEVGFYKGNTFFMCLLCICLFNLDFK